MFKRRQDYLMAMDVEVDYTPIEKLILEQGLDPDDVRATGLQSLIGHVERTARESVEQNGQKWKGAQVDPEGEWPRFQVRFQGEYDGAVAAFELWGENVGTLGGTKRILMASLRGSDGTNLQYMDEEHQKELMETFDALPQETQDMIDELMDPGR